jgi:hypothetical protein
MAVTRTDFRQVSASARERRRREIIWAWLSLGALLLCWDASSRLDERVSPPRVRIGHAAEAEPPAAPTIRRH